MLVRWHRQFGARRAEFSPEQRAVRLALQRRGLLPFDLSPVAESVRRVMCQG
jgi:hypothetical protein